MGNSSRSMIDSLSDTMNYLNSLEEEFMKLKQEANKLETMNKEMYTNITRIESTYVKKVSTWYVCPLNIILIKIIHSI